MTHSELTQLRSLLASLLLEHENEIVNDRFTAAKTTLDTVGALIEALYSAPKTWSVVESITDHGNQIGIGEDVPEDVVVIAGPMAYDEAVKYCEDYCTKNHATMYEGDCMFIDYAQYK
jgi:hypothetical protein